MSVLFCGKILYLILILYFIMVSYRVCDGEWGFVVDMGGLWMIMVSFKVYWCMIVNFGIGGVCLLMYDFGKFYYFYYIKFCFNYSCFRILILELLNCFLYKYFIIY